MDKDQKLMELLEELEKNNRKQVFYARIQCIFAVLAALCCVFLLLSCLKVVPQLQDMVMQAETVLENLETVTDQLANADLIAMVENMDNLVGDVDMLVKASRTGVEDTLAILDKIDFDRLNDAIKDLSDVIEPVAKFFNSFKFG